MRVQAENRFRKEISPEWMVGRKEFSENYILYRPRSSVESPSSHLRSSSLVDFSEIALEILELLVG
jgi:hypothetical protein